MNNCQSFLDNEKKNMQTVFIHISSVNYILKSNSYEWVDTLIPFSVFLIHLNMLSSVLIALEHVRKCFLVGKRLNVFG